MAQTAYALSDKGKVREKNEDAFNLLPEQGLFIVSDGMGGRKAGAVASKLVVETLPQMIQERVAQISVRQSKAISQAMRDTLVDLSEHVRREGESELELRGMDATVVLAYLRGHRLYIANMGDIRGHLYRDGKLEQLTEDHSIVGILLKDGEITSEEAKTHPARGIVSRYIGIEGTVYPDVKSIKVSKGDTLLLCSDGLTGMASDEAISDILSKDGDLQQKCQTLVEAANKGGGHDNITVLLVEMD